MTDFTETPEAAARRMARRLLAVERLCSGRPGYHTIAIKELLTAMSEADQADPELPDGFTAHTCVTLKCPLCGYFHDEDEGYSAHFSSVEEALGNVRGYDWRPLRDGRVLCPSDDEDHKALIDTVGLAPDDAPSAVVDGQALEDAGQLTITETEEQHAQR
jgi:hypothetical protein